MPVAPPIDEQLKNLPDAESGEVISSEVLRLRSRVTRLNARKRELASVLEENERLRHQLAESQKTPATGNPLPPGYIRKAEAQFAGYSTPENTLQSFLWAMQHHDITNFMQALSSRQAERVGAGVSRSPEAEKEFFKPMDSIPGLAIQNRQDLPDGTVKLEVIVAPGLPTDEFRMQSINGEWKLDSDF